MKTLLFLPLLILLSACAADLSEEEQRVEEQKEILEKAVEVFKHNESVIEDAVSLVSNLLLVQ